MNTMRKVAMSIAAGGILTEALRNMMVWWSLDDGIEASLAKLIAADANDFSSRNRLRLLKVCRTFCSPEVPSQIAGLIVSLSAADRVLYDILGHESR